MDGNDDLDAYLQRFERFATTAKWQKLGWVSKLMHRVLLSGRALEVYSRLSEEAATNYDRVKLALMKSYDLTEDGYRPKFRASKPEVDKNPEQFIVRLDTYLLRWKVAIVRITIDTPYLKGEVEVQCLPDVIYDLIVTVGNVPGARPAEEENPTWQEACHVTTRSRAKKDGQVNPLKTTASTDCVIEWSRENRVHLNSDKCKELRISFSKRPGYFDPIVIEGKELEVVGSVKLNIASDLTWNSHILEVIKKASKRLYFLVQLKRARVPLQDLVLFYTSCVRSVMEYAIPAFYNALPLYLKNELLRIKKPSISIITGGDCVVAQDLGIQPILEHYEFLCQKLFKGILDNPSHKLKALLPPIHKPSYNLKNKRHFNMPRLQTSRTMNTFIFAMARKFNG
ncbi:uncharacterized protein [Montipora foliosa]|uniref:uncharacterized protein n=1 Tax=Montipora foliosa TaxID=591990 RepID=UPI0035F15A3F